MPAHGIMFHHFHGGDFAPSQGSIDAAQLRTLIDGLRPYLLPAAEWRDRALREALRPQDICLTFDDTLLCQFEIARPVLRECGLTGFWFISSGSLRGVGPRLDVHRAFREKHFANMGDFYAAFFWAVERSVHADEAQRRLAAFDPRSFLSAFSFYSDDDRRYRYLRDEVLGMERFDDVMSALMASVGADPAELARGIWMTAAQVRELAGGEHVIGLHSHTHPTRMAYLPRSEQEREYRDNYMELMQLLGQPPVAMSHPCNSYNDETLALLRKLGIRIGFRADMDQKPHGELEYPREDHTLVLQRIAKCESRSSPATSRVTSR